jgi:hypothetical protein
VPLFTQLPRRGQPVEKAVSEPSGGPETVVSASESEDNEVDREKMTPEEKSESARKVTKARWDKKRQEER